MIPIVHFGQKVEDEETEECQNRKSSEDSSPPQLPLSAERGVMASQDQDPRPKHLPHPTLGKDIFLFLSSSISSLIRESSNAATPNGKVNPHFALKTVQNYLFLVLYNPLSRSHSVNIVNNKFKYLVL